MNPTPEQLMQLCNKVRKAAQQVSGDHLIWYFPSFPKAWCGCVSRVLGALLCSQFPDNEFYYVCGVRSKYYESHAWVEYKGMVLDTTADQFEDCDIPIIVKQYEDSLFHQSFLIELREPCSIKDIDNEEERIIWKQVWKEMCSETKN